MYLGCSLTASARSPQASSRSSWSCSDSPVAWLLGVPNYAAVLVLGLVLGFAGASFAVALPQAGRWYPPKLQGVVMGLAGAGNVGVVIDSLIAPRLANAFGWRAVFGLALIPAVLVLIAYILCSKEAPVVVKEEEEA